MSSIGWGAPSNFKPWPRSAVRQPRLICCYVPNGVNIQEWVPSSTGASYKLSPTLEKLRAYQSEFTIVSGLGHPSANGGHNGADTWLTGADLKAHPGSDYTNTVSVDQVIAEVHGRETRFPSLQLGDMPGTGLARHSHTLSFDRSGTPLPVENVPRRVFERLFVPDSAGDKATALRRYAERRSILDDLAAETRGLERRLGTTDRRKLDEYLSSVRQVEVQIERIHAWDDKPKVTVAETGLQLLSKPMNAHDRMMWLDVMMELSYLAFVTDSTRVITFEWAREASGFGGSGENHHELSHHGGDAGMLARLAIIDQFHLARLGRFLGMLRSTSEADGNMLDHTIVLYGSGMNSGLRGDHSPKNLPTLVAGGTRLGLKHGRHVAFDQEKHPPLSNLLLTVAQAMKVETGAFSDATSTLTGLA